MKTPNIELPELAQSESPAYLNLNDGFRALDAIVQLTVISMSIADPPAAEQGARYIVAASPTGVWAGHAKHVAYKTASGWDFRTPRTGWVVIVNDESTATHKAAYFFNGTTWQRLVYNTGIVDLVDVLSLTAPNDGESLVYDSGLGKWVPTVIGNLTVDEIGSPGVSLSGITRIRFSGGAVVTSEDSVTAHVEVISSGGSGDGGNVTPDTHKTTAHALDDDFEDGALAGKWAWRNQNTSTATLVNGSVVITASGTASQNVNMIEQVAPSTPWKIRAKISLRGDNQLNKAGLAGVNNSNGRLIVAYFYLDSNAVPNTFTIAQMAVSKYTTVSTFGSHLRSNQNVVQVFGGAFNWMYWELENDGTNYYFRLSNSGVNGSFVLVASEALATFITTIDRVGIFADSQNAASGGACVCDWFRGGF